MNKNNNILLLFIGILSMCSVSCNLNLVPLDKLSPETYFSNEDELKLYSNKFYSDLIPSAGSIYGGQADEIIITPLSAAVSGQRIVPATEGGWSWSALRHVNYFLDHINNTTDKDIRQQYEGLGKFFRAYFYFNKLKRFGGVPWFSHVLGSDDPSLYKQRDSRSLIIDSIVRDLNYAIKYLPEKKDVYRVNKWTALALKSRATLFEGTFREYHGLSDYKKYLEICDSASEELMSNGGYALYTTGATPYRDLFATSDARGQEVILARDYDKDLNLINNVQNFENSTTLGRPGLNKVFVNTYLMKDGSRFTKNAGYKTEEFVEEMKNRDPRLAQTIRTPGYTRVNSSKKVAPNLSYSLTGYHLIKYSMGKIYDSYKNGITDMPIFRIAEIYLNYAEAKAELGTLTQADLDKSINLLRNRANMPHLILSDANSNPDPYLSSSITGYPNVKGPNKGVILEIRRERGIELVMEGFRYWDVMRWKAGKLFEKPFLGMYFKGLGDYDLDNDGTVDLCLYQGSKPSSSADLFLEAGKDIILSNGTSGNIIVHGNISRTFREDRDYLYPIPSEEIHLSNGNLKQNPNW